MEQGNMDNVPKVQRRPLRWGDVRDVVPSNLLPLVGALFFGWDGWEIVLFYYLETVVIGLFHAVKLAISQPGTQENLGGQRTPMTPAFATILFVGNYGLFTAIQMMFFWEHIVWPAMAGQDGMSFWISIALLFSGRAIEEMRSFFLPGKFRTTTVDGLFFLPYSRIFVQQLFAIVGTFVITITGASAIVAVIAFVAIKTGAELYIATFWDSLITEMGRKRAARASGNQEGQDS